MSPRTPCVYIFQGCVGEAESCTRCDGQRLTVAEGRPHVYGHTLARRGGKGSNFTAGKYMKEASDYTSSTKPRTLTSVIFTQRRHSRPVPSTPAAIWDVSASARTALISASGHPATSVPVSVNSCKVSFNWACCWEGEAQAGATCERRGRRFSASKGETSLVFISIVFVENSFTTLCETRVFLENPDWPMSTTFCGNACNSIQCQVEVGKKC